MRRWHILTPELPPACGGVGDYTIQLAEALARTGDEVSVYSPPASASWNSPVGITVCALPDRFGSQSQQVLTSILGGDRASHLLIQYVPAVFGRHGRNVSFCKWVRARARGGTDVRVMFHEPYSYFTWRADHVVTALAQRSMARTLLDAAPIVYLSTDTWRRYLSPYGPSAIRNAVTLPIPSAIPRAEAPRAVSDARGQALSTSGATRLVGHFGTYGRHIAPLLSKIATTLLSSDPGLAVLCAGAGSDGFVTSMRRAHPKYRHRLVATGRVPSRELSVALQACDVLVQPYPDGVTTRRTSVMAGLANARPIVTCDGPLTEDVWRHTQCVALAPSSTGIVETCRELLHDDAARAALAARALATYSSRFDLRHTIEEIRRPVPTDAEALCRV